jgi:8-oxo-dGTP pyrophosphatase MutT (NUDIX family)
MELSPYKGFGTYNKIPVSKTCVITHNQRHGNVYGESSIRRVYKHWKYKDAILEMWATALDRYGTPVTWMKVPRLPTGRVIQDPYAEGGVREEMMADSASAAIAGIHGGTGLVVENPDPNNDVDLGTLTTGNNYGTSFMDYLNHIDRAVYRGLLIPQTIFHENAGGGINNTSKTHFEVFKLMIRALYMQFVEPFVEQVIGRLIRYNFNETDPGYFEFLPFDASMADLLATMLEKMVNMGAVDTSDLSDLNMVRSMVGLSPREKPAIQNIGQVVKDYEAELRSKEKVAEIRAEASIEQAAMRSHSLEHAAEIRVDGPNAPSSPDSVEMHEEEANASVGKKTGKGTPKTGAKKSSFRGQSTKDLVAQAKATAKSVRANKPVKLSLGEALSVPEYPPEVVVAVIMDGNGRILLMRRSATESNRAKEWETPGGHLEPGETIQAAAQREILEETGLTIHEIGAYALRFELRDGEGYGLMVGAKAAQGNNNIQMDLAEHDRYEWVWPEDLGDFDPVPPNFVANVTQVWEANMFTATP